MAAESITQEMVYEYLLEAGPQTSEDIASVVLVHRVTIDRKLEGLMARGLVNRTRPSTAGKGANPYVYEAIDIYERLMLILQARLERLS